MSRQTRLVHAVAGVLKRGDRLLVAERPRDKPYSGYWEFPGGKVEPDEAPKIALRRELAEELGILVIEACEVVKHEHIYPDKTVQLDVWLVTSFEGEPQGLENQELRWVTMAEMMDLKLLEGNWAILEKLKAVLG